MMILRFGDDKRAIEQALIDLVKTSIAFSKTNKKNSNEEFIEQTIGKNKPGYSLELLSKFSE